MAKLEEKQKALELRKMGKSYSQIKEVINVSKSTLSLWLEKYPLPEAKIRELRDWNQKRIERYRETRRLKKEALLDEAYQNEKNYLLPFSQKELAVAGFFLYWGEGGKTKMSEPTVSNTDPAVIKAFLYWLEKCFEVDKAKIKIKLHLYADMDVQKEMFFWSKTLNIPISHFLKPYIKNSNQQYLSYRRSYIHGTCNAMVRDAILGRRIMMGLKVFEDYFNNLKRA